MLVIFSSLILFLVSTSKVYSNGNIKSTNPNGGSHFAISINRTITDVTCKGNSDGAINITVSGGVAPYTFLWNNGATTEDLAGIPAGTYVVTVTGDDGEIKVSNNFVVDDGVDLSSGSSENIKDVTCHQGQDGSIKITVSAGVGPYSYSWTDSEGNPVGDGKSLLKNVKADDYSVLVTDGNGCTLIKSYTVSQPPAYFTITPTITNVSCNGGFDGAISLAVTTSGTGNGVFSYSWSHGASGSLISGLIAGTYEVEISDNKDCEVHTFTITEPVSLSLSTTKVDVLCYGSSTGSIDLTVTGGTAPYSYVWSSGGITEDVSSLSAGNYTVIVTDANGCTSNTGVTITEPTVLSLSSTKVDVLCNVNSTGSIDLTVSGGTAPYSYNWSNGSTVQDISSLSAGNYTVAVTDANGCTANTAVTITEPTALNLSTTKVDVLCNGNATGSIDLTVSGGTGPYTYNWNTGATTQDISTLSAGNYTVTVTDANGCTDNTAVTISEPTALNLSTTKVDVLCNGNTTGSIDLTVTGGTAPYTYAWNNGATSEDLGSLAAGNYTVTVTDGNGCTANTAVTITEPTALNLSTTKVDVLCNGNTTGSIDLTVSGGTAPYTYNWSNGATTQDISALSAGNYTVTVTDANGCAANTAVTVTEPTALNLSTTKVDVLCNGNATGAVDLTVSGGTGPYTYNWSNGATTQDISSLSAGNYTVMVTDGNGCTANTAVTITEPTALTLSTTKVDVLCNGNATGSIDLTVAGGTGPYTYNWSNGATTQDISALSAGNYTVTVTDGNGCTANTAVTITEPTALNLSTTKIDVTCKGETNGSIDLTVTGGTGPYTYNWSNGATTQDIGTLTAGNYTVTVTDGNGCTDNTAVTVTEPATSISATRVVTDVLCNGALTGSIDLTTSGGVAPYTYLWSNGATTEDVTTLAAGSYSVTITDAVGCITIPNIVVSEPTAMSLSNTKVDVLCNGNTTGSIDLTVTGGTAPYTYAWSNGATKQDISTLSAGSYTVTVTDGNGCTDNTAVTITEPSILSLSTTKVDISCNGGNNGSIDLSVSGGTAPHTYLWNSGATTEDISALTAGSYTVTVTDANGCNDNANVILFEPASNIIAAPVVTDVKCKNGSDGSIDLTVSGGTAPYSFLWSFGATTEDVTMLPAGSYDVTITDANGCLTITGIVISEPALALTLTNTKTDVSCDGGSDGGINLTVTGGTAPYTYAWSNGATTEDLDGLAVGSYSVTVIDANGCTEGSSVTISAPDALNLIMVPTNVSCTGGSDGSINLTVSGGTPGYSYSWDTGATTEDVGSLSVGTYSVTVTDANGCTKTQSVTIAEPPLIQLAEVIVDAGCNGGSAGSVDLQVSGGTAPYTYSWSSGANTEDISGLSFGLYTVTVTDANGCSEVKTISVNEDSALQLSHTVIAASCNGGSDGSIDLSVTGGTAPYTYSWSNGGATQDISSLTAGSYDVTVTDNIGCKSILSVAVTQPEPISVTSSKIDVSCDGGSYGSISLSLSGGTQPYSFTIIPDPAFGIILSVSDANVCPNVSFAIRTNLPNFVNTLGWNVQNNALNIFNLAPGDYEIIRPDLGNAVIENVTIGAPIPISISGIAQNTSCFNGVDGEIALTVSGGTAPYTYSWSNGRTGKDINNLAAGNYTVEVTDAKNCKQSQVISVGQPAELLVAGNTVDPRCFGNADGRVDLTVTGGRAPYTYSWSDGTNNANLIGVNAGTYEVAVTDAKGCIITASYTLTAPPQIVLSVSETDPTCFGATDGEIDLSITGGTAPYTYSWSFGATTQDVSGIGAGSYMVTVIDANGCVAQIGQTLTEPPELLVTSVVVDVSCFGESTGSIDLTLEGGLGPYSVLWSNGSSSEDLINLPAGNYSVDVSDATTCIQTLNFTITEPEQLGADIRTVDILCHGLSTGSADLTVTGGRAPYTFAWSNGATSEDLSALPPGSYTVVVTDANNCQEIQTVTITEPEKLALDYSLVDVSCNSGNDGAIDLSVVGGVEPYVYSWSNGASTEDLDVLQAGDYIITVMDANGCSIIQNIEVTEPENIQVNVETGFDVDCEGRDVSGNVTAHVTGGVGPYLYFWDNLAPKTINRREGLDQGPHQLLVRDANGCEFSTTFEIILPELGISEITLIAQIDPTGAVTVNTPVHFADNPTDNIISWLWEFGDGNSSAEQSPTYTYSEIGDYRVLLTVTDANGCSLTLEKGINVDVGYRLIMPTAFSPNGDGKNDKMAPEFFGLSSIRMVVYNNWGQVVYSSPNLEDGGWSGLIRGKNAPAGGYAYKIVAESFSKEKFEKTGTFLLVR